MAAHRFWHKLARNQKFDYSSGDPLLFLTSQTPPAPNAKSTTLKQH